MKMKIFSKPDCQFCVNAKTLLGIKDIPFTEIEVGRDVTRDEFFEAVPTAKTFPQIFVIEGGEETLIGGYTDLVAYLKSR